MLVAGGEFGAEDVWQGGERAGRGLVAEIYTIA